MGTSKVEHFRILLRNMAISGKLLHQLGHGWERSCLQTDNFVLCAMITNARQIRQIKADKNSHTLKDLKRIKHLHMLRLHPHLHVHHWICSAAVPNLKYSKAQLNKPSNKDHTKGTK